jgi:dUTP pyrophosphatase
MKFLIKANCDEAIELYKNHSTYHQGDSGLDLFIVADEVIPAGETRLVDLGISCQLKGTRYISKYHANDTKVDKYFSYNMYSRSSISKTPLRLANGVGLCDAGYLGPLKAALHNTGTTDYTVKKGERYVQLARPDLELVSFELVEELRSTDRGTGGFGSTGK